MLQKCTTSKMIVVINDIVDVSLSYKILTVLDDNIFCVHDAVSFCILQMKLTAFTL